MSNQNGYTLLELLVSTAILGILALLVSNFYVDRLIDYARNDTLIILQTNTKQGLTSVERDTKAARSIESANQWPDANGPSGNQYGWASNSNVLVLAVPAVNSSGDLIYVDSTHNALQTNDVIYYVDSTKKTLYRRVLANPVSGNVAVTTCPPSKATSSCPADGKVIEDVANLALVYYDTSNSVIAIPANGYSLDATLTQSRVKFARTYTNSLTSRASLRNKP